MIVNNNMLSLVEEYNRASYVFISGQFVYNLSSQGALAIPDDVSFRLISALTSDIIKFRETLDIILSLIEDPDNTPEKIEHYRGYFSPFYEQAERIFRAVVQHPLPNKNLVTAFHVLIRSTAQVGLSFLRSEVDISSLQTEDGSITRRDILNFYISLPDHYKSLPATDIVDLLISHIKDSTKTSKTPTIDTPVSMKEVIQALSVTSSGVSLNVSQFVQHLIEQTHSGKTSRTAS